MAVWVFGFKTAPIPTGWGLDPIDTGFQGRQREAQPHQRQVHCLATRVSQNSDMVYGPVAIATGATRSFKPLSRVVCQGISWVNKRAAGRKPSLAQP